MAGLWSRFTSIFKAKASSALNRAEDPRQTLDYSYEKQLDLLQKVRRGVADVATSRKRLELQLASLAAAGRPLRAAGPGRPGAGPRGPGPRGADPPLRDPAAGRRPAGPAGPAAGRRGEAGRRPAAAGGEGRGVPHPQGDAEGDLHGRRGTDQDQRGVHRDLDGVRGRRAGGPAGRGQDRPDAGPGRAPSTSWSRPEHSPTPRAWARTTSRSSSSGCPAGATSSAS